jgi:hypothetical protein
LVLPSVIASKMPLDDKGELPVLDDGGRQYALALALLAHVIAGGKQPDDGNDQSSVRANDTITSIQ